MKKYVKNITWSLVGGLFFTFVPALCCCMDIAVAAEPVSHHSEAAAVHEHPHGGHDHDGHDHGAKSSGHDHSQCNHPQIIANLANASAFYAAKAESSFLKLSKQSALVYPEIIPFKTSSSPPRETGPPRAGPGATPLYLQISVLRI